MEEGQRLLHRICLKCVCRSGLNPCCNGRGSKTSPTPSRKPRCSMVLILVVMEEGQRLSQPRLYAGRESVLILVVMEEGQRLSVHHHINN